MPDSRSADPLPYRFGAGLMLVAGAGLLLAILVCADGLGWMLNSWQSSEEYSYGYLIPLISGFLIWQRKEQLRALEFRGAWSGLAVALLGLALNVLGKLAAVFAMQQYAFVLILTGTLAAAAGWRVVRELAMPLVVLLFMIPLPNFVLNNLSANLQLISSHLGVAVIRLFGISVYAEGNVIDLGAMQLQVAEACSGLRYLFPLMTLGIIIAYFYQATLWKRIILFLSSIPITILMNSLRIGLIGVTVEYWGPRAAAGLLHDFEGWVVFMLSAAVLLLEMLLLNLIGKPRRRWREIFGIEWPPPAPQATQWREHRLGVPLRTGLVVLAVAAAATLALPRRIEAPQPRAALVEFPMQIGAWLGTRDRLDEIYIDTLKFDDYLLANYSHGGTQANLYVAWYDSQRAGRAMHSPRTCIPGGGWHITSLVQRELAPIRIGGKVLRVNRAVIADGTHRDIVYYWFQQRGRVVTNEYLVKWYLFWDALTRNRTDGALVRVVMPLAPGEPEAVVDSSLAEFIGAVAPRLVAYIPG